MQTRFEEWAALYKPIQNTIAEHGEYSGRLFGLTEREKEAVGKATKVWTLIENDGYLELLHGVHLTNRLGYFIAEVPYVGQSGACLRLGSPERDTPERARLALIRAQQSRAVDVAKDHERDVCDCHEGRMTQDEYQANEAERNAYIDGVQVFFNLWLNEYCVEDVAFEMIPCGRCGAANPGDPCRGCGRSQPLSIEDYYRANIDVIEIPTAIEPESATSSAEEGDSVLVYRQNLFRIRKMDRAIKSNTSSNGFPGSSVHPRAKFPSPPF